MNRYPTAVVPAQAHRGLALLLAVVGLVGLSIAMHVVLGLAGPPPYIRDLFGPDVSALAAGLLASALIWLGAGSAWLATQFLRRPWLTVGLPVWAAGLGLVAWALVCFAMADAAGPVTEWNGSGLGRFAVAWGSLALVLIVGSTAVGAVSTMTWETASKYVMFLLLAMAPWVALSLVAFPSVIHADGAFGRARATPWLTGFSVLLLVFALGVNGAAVGHSLRQPTRRRLLFSLAATCLLVPAGWFLVNLAALPLSAAAPSPLQRLLGAEAPAGLPEGALLLRWSVAQVLAVLALAWGHWVGLLVFAKGESADSAAAAGRRQVAPALRRPAEPGHPGRPYGVLAVLYAVFVVYGSLVPLEFSSRSFDEALRRFLETPYLLLRIENRADLVANLLLYIPLTFFAMGALTREGRRPGSGLIGLCVTGAACALAIAVEFGQIFFPPRTVSLNDILVECVGGAAGVVVWVLFGERVTAWVRDLRRVRDRRRLAIHVLTGYLVVLVLYELYPFDFVLSVDELLQEIRAGKVHLAPLADWDGLSLPAVAVKTALLAPLGYLLALAGLGRGRILRTAGLGALFAAVIQLAHIFIYTRGVSSTDVLLGALGTAAGAWLADRFGPIARRPFSRTPAWRAVSWAGCLALAVGGAAATVWYKWQPFAFEWPREGVWRGALDRVCVPFYHQYHSTEFHATLQVTQDFAVPLVLAMLLTSVLERWGTAGRWLAGAVAAGVAVSAEAGQMFFPPRVPDLTTLFIAGAGAVAGVLLHDPFVRVFVKAPSAEDEPDGPCSPT